MDWAIELTTLIQSLPIISFTILRNVKKLKKVIHKLINDY